MKKRASGRVVNLTLLTLLGLVHAYGQSADDLVADIRADAAYQQALEAIDGDYERFVEELIRFTEIPAPPFMEDARAAAYLEALRELGLEDVEMDAEGNVMGVRRGAGGPLLAVTAHLDTVFPEGTDVTVTREGTRLSAPGVGDDTAGLATLLTIVRAMDTAGIHTTSDILFVGDVGEEGPGDLRGVKHLLFEGPYRDRIRMFVSVEGGRQSDITNAALGSKRYRATFKGPGGHSYGEFGMVSPAFAMGDAIRRLTEMDVPDDPKTTFNVGVMGGGTSVNSIPVETWMDVDLRSEDGGELSELDDAFVRLMNEAVDGENARGSTGEGLIELDLEVIGDRPSGEIPVDSPIVQAAAAAYRAFGIEPTYSRSSTDANIPISLGIPAITIDRGGFSGRSHSLDEWIDVEREATLKGLHVVLTTILAIAGLEEN